MGQAISKRLGFRSPEPYLTRSEPEENVTTSKLTSNEREDAPNVPSYLDKSPCLMTVPPAKDGGMTQWILVCPNFSPNHRPLLASRNTFSKVLVDCIYCDPGHRGQDYATLLMRELAKFLPHWQTETHKCVASEADIGKNFYADVGCHRFPSLHPESEALPNDSTVVAEIFAEDLASLCLEDGTTVRKAMSSFLDSGKLRHIILPDHEHMLWHHSREEWVCDRLFGNRPLVKGAVSGRPGSRVWVVWTHRFYSPPCGPEASDNTLYILRTVVEDQMSLNHLTSLVNGTSSINDTKCNDLIDDLRAVLEAAQNEAFDWNLHDVKL
ncbi:hypothetical protein MMC09_002002 [Bachmanniomyces sp. S44760]|nr:hypothetical protein [Bachmanniomyces sp. S44760]